MNWTESTDDDGNTRFHANAWQVSQVLRRDRIWWVITAAPISALGSDEPHEFVSASGAKMVCERRERLATAEVKA